MTALDRSRPVLGTILALALVASIGIVDRLTGFEISFSIFYLIPITLATMLAGRKAGLAISALAAITWLIADSVGGHNYSNAWIPYWNSAVRLGYFTIHTMLLSALKNRIAKEKDLARLDSLTGSANSRQFQEALALEIVRAKRRPRPMTLVYCDLDDFKLVNDRLGHAEGDEILKAVAGGIRAAVRPTDLVSRIGGDEFAILLPETSSQDASAILPRIQKKIRNSRGFDRTGAAASLGAITFESSPPDAEFAMKLADEAMYRVKKSGKNAIEHSAWSGEQLATSVSASA